MFSELPRFSSLYQQSIDENGEIVKYKTLMQVTIVNDVYAFTLDDPETPTQIGYMDSIDLLMDEKTISNFGFRPEYAYLDEEKNE